MNDLTGRMALATGATYGSGMAVAADGAGALAVAVLDLARRHARALPARSELRPARRRPAGRP